MHLVDVSVQEISDLILKLDSHKAMGVDAISTRFIKASPVGMATLLVIPFQQINVHTKFYLIWNNCVGDTICMDI